jgi:2-iminobutanoate/2-iminopropanoate deaminase
MSRNAINPKSMFAAGPYSHAIKTGGLVFLSGKTGTDSAGKLADGGIGPQTKQTFANLKVVLEAAGLTFDHVVKCNVYLTSMADFAAMNAVYAEHFSKPEPARTTVAVAALPGGAIVEIEMVAESK